MARNVEAEMSGRHSIWGLVALGSSFVLHGICYASLASVPRAVKPAPVRSLVTFEVPEPQAPALPKAEEPAPAPTTPETMPVRPAVVHRAQPTPAPTAPPTSEPAKPPSAAPLDLTGVTLTGDNGSFSMAAGNGESRTGPIGPGSGHARPTEMPAAPRAEANNALPLVALADLSVRPSAPALENSLLAHYPAEARRRGLSGSATVRARIDADGVVRRITTLSEAVPGFGEACRQTLRNSRWGAPRDRNGHAVATEIRYTCRFLVNR